MKKKIISALFMLLIVYCTNAQEIVANSGGEGSTTEVSVNWTIGEPVIETISNENNVLTQGFHQSKLTVTIVSEVNADGLKINVFPNPTTMFLNVETENKDNASIEIQLLDMNGKLLLEQKTSENKFKIDMQTYNPAAYFLKVSTENVVKTYQIIKN